jgi:hypothetical protein
LKDSRLAHDSEAVRLVLLQIARSLAVDPVMVRFLASVRECGENLYPRQISPTSAANAFAVNSGVTVAGLPRDPATARPRHTHESLHFLSLHCSPQIQN